MPALIRVAAVTAALGGAAWLVKAVAILATGVQPPLVFEVAPLLLAVGLLGLRSLLGAHPRHTGVIGGRMAGLAGALAVASLLITVGRPSSEDGPGLLIFGTFLCILAALILLGLAARQRTDLAFPIRTLPLLLGLLTLPLIVVGGALATVNERLLEVPLVVLGAAWIWLGLAMWLQEAATRTAHRRSF